MAVSELPLLLLLGDDPACVASDDFSSVDAATTCAFGLKVPDTRGAFSSFRFRFSDVIEDTWEWHGGLEWDLGRSSTTPIRLRAGGFWAPDHDGLTKAVLSDADREYLGIDARAVGPDGRGQFHWTAGAGAHVGGWTLDLGVRFARDVTDLVATVGRGF